MGFQFLKNQFFFQCSDNVLMEYKQYKTTSLLKTCFKTHVKFMYLRFSFQLKDEKLEIVSAQIVLVR